MSPVTENIHVFRTNIATHNDAQKVGNVLDKHEHINQWSVDLTDCDRVLRVRSARLCQSDIISLINSQGFQCSELE